MVQAQTQTHQSGLVILRLNQLTPVLGLSRSAIYDRLDAKSPRHDHTFPRQIKLGSRSVGFLESEIHAWLRARMDAR
jgi:predicted DNA-binding transcriptional regulator AlpA